MDGHSSYDNGPKIWLGVNEFLNFSHHDKKYLQKSHALAKYATILDIIIEQLYSHIWCKWELFLVMIGGYNMVSHDFTDDDILVDGYCDDFNDDDLKEMLDNISQSM